MGGACPPSRKSWLPGEQDGEDRRIAAAISLHKPHPGNIVKMYAVDEVMRVLTDEGLI